MAPRVILTYGRSLMALVIARSLAQRGVEVIGCDDVSMTVLSFSRHVKETFTVAPWTTEPEQFLQDLEHAVREYAPRDGRPYVLMPVFRDIDLITRNRARFEPLIKVAAPRIESIAMVTPKDRLADLAERVDLCAPRTWRPSSETELEKAARELELPVIVKPKDGAGGRGVSLVETKDELKEKIEEIGYANTPLIQEHCVGEDYCVAALAERGELKTLMAYRNVATYPVEAGAGAVRETVDAAPFEAVVRRMLTATHWDGVAQFDFRWTGEAKEKPRLIEVNARFWAGIFHSIETGVDFPWLLLQQTIGDAGSPMNEPPPEPEIGARTRTAGVWLLSAIEDVAASDAHFAAAGDAWRRAKRDLKQGDPAAALFDAFTALKEGLNVGDAAKQLRDLVSTHRKAPSELTDADDPLVGLGALFVLSSLVRHGKLPPEVTYKAEDHAPPAPPPPRKRPIIGITKPERGDWLAWRAMKFAVWLAGGKALKLTAAAPREPHSIDGLILGGGADVYPKRYEGKPRAGYRYDLARGDMEASWATAARRLDMPVLGVCRGAQMLNVLAGGTLHTDMASFENPRRSEGAFSHLFMRKPIRVFARSRLAQAMGAGEFQVNAIHVQSVDRVGANLSVAAREPNRMVQAIEDRSHPFWIGVQFHPELLIYRRPFRKLFKALVDAARAHAEQRHAALMRDYHAHQAAAAKSSEGKARAEADAPAA